jgi:hypothetical protein
MLPTYNEKIHEEIDELAEKYMSHAWSKGNTHKICHPSTSGTCDGSVQIVGWLLQQLREINKGF